MRGLIRCGVAHDTRGATESATLGDEDSFSDVDGSMSDLMRELAGVPGARIADPLFSHTLFGLYLALMVWGGLWLRSPALRALIPFVQAKD